MIGEYWKAVRASVERLEQENPAITKKEAFSEARKE